MFRAGSLLRAAVERGSRGGRARGKKESGEERSVKCVHLIRVNIEQC